MKFSSIIQKNFMHNLTKYISFYFVNALIIAMLFMYGSLIFNDAIIAEIGKSSLYETVNMALLGVVLFSIVFITYTNMSFLKNRGKEFGMYLTLGMTTKDLSKLVFIENLGIMIASLITGVLSGALFSKLFYMGLNKVLVGTDIPFILNYKSFLLSIGIFSIIFIGNFIFNMLYIRRVSIIDAIKSSKKKEVGKSNILVGILSLIVFAIAAYCLPKTLLKEMFKEQSFMIGIFVFLTLICPYMIIGSLIGVIKVVFSKFPKLYNNNLLVLSNLSHRFLGYKNLIYMLSLLIAGSMFFVGFSYSVYSSTRDMVDLENPYDIMFIETEKYNKVSKEKVEEAIASNKGEVENYKVLEYIEAPMFREEEENQISLYDDNQSIISETNYNKHMGTNIDVKSDEAIYATVYNETMNYTPQTVTFSLMNENELEKVREVSELNEYILSTEEFKSLSQSNINLEFNGEKIKYEKGVPFTNIRHSNYYGSGKAYIVDDKEYEILESKVSKEDFKKFHLMNVKNGDKEFQGVIKYLKDENGLDDSYWNQGDLWGKYEKGERGEREAYRPIYKEEIVRMRLDENGMMLFTMIFIGILFVIANGIVLYYKVLSDIGEEKERITSLNRIGVLSKEIKSIISKELAITFFMPIIFGGGLGLYYLYVMNSNTEIVWLLMKKCSLVLIIICILQLVFYFISRRRFIKELNVWM